MSVLTKRAPSFFNPVRVAGWSAVGLILLAPLARLALAGAVILAVLVIWAEAAVGIF